MVQAKAQEPVIVYARPEDEFYHKYCSWSCTFPIANREVEKDELQPLRMVLGITSEQAVSARYAAVNVCIYCTMPAWYCQWHGPAKVQKLLAIKSMHLQAGNGSSGWQCSHLITCSGPARMHVVHGGCNTNLWSVHAADLTCERLQSLCKSVLYRNTVAETGTHPC